MRTRTIMCYVVGIILIVVVGSIPVNQIVERDHRAYYLSNQDNRIEVTFGGPTITWVTVECNTTTQVRYMYQNGTWVGQENVLLSSTFAMKAKFNYFGEHSTIVVEIIADGPFMAAITYTYLVAERMTYFERVFNTFALSI